MGHIADQEKMSLQEDIHLVESVVHKNCIDWLKKIKQASFSVE